MKSLLLLSMVVLCAGAAAQGAQAPAKKAVPAAKSAAATTPAAARSATAKPVARLKSALDKVTLEAYLRHLFVWGRNVNVQISDPKPSELAGFLEVNVHAWRADASQDEKFLISRDGRKIVRATVFDVDENPFRPELAKLKTQFQPSFGTPGAPAVLVVFTDFECPFCREEAKMLRQNLLSAYPTQVRVYFQDYPLAQIHPWALAAALAGRCVFRQNAAAFWDYHDWVYEQQAQINAGNFRSRLLEWAKGKPIDAGQLARCATSSITKSITRRRRGTPAKIAAAKFGCPSPHFSATTCCGARQSRIHSSCTGPESSQEPGTVLSDAARGGTHEHENGPRPPLCNQWVAGIFKRDSHFSLARVRCLQRTWSAKSGSLAPVLVRACGHTPSRALNLPASRGASLRTV